MQHRHFELRRRVFDGGDQFDDNLRPMRTGGRKTCRAAVARLDAQRRAHHRPPDPRARTAALRRRALQPRIAGAAHRRHRDALAARGSGAAGAIGSIGPHLLDLRPPAPRAGDRSGRRSPTGESPGIRNRCRARSIHRPVCHSGPLLPAPRCSGSTKPTGWPSPRSKTRRRRSRSSGSSSLLSSGIDIDRQLALLEQIVERIFVGRHHDSPGSTRQAARQRLRRTARGIGGRSRSRAPDRRSSCGSRQSGSAVGAPVAGERPARQRFARDTICPARSAAGRRARTARAGAAAGRPPAAACSGPSAAVFHSSPSMSSMETKVGSPPMVRRTSPARSSRVDRDRRARRCAATARRCRAW